MFYTYLWLREDGTPYYVGKGKGRRAFVKSGHSCLPPPSQNRILIQEFPDEFSALEAEKFLIALYGRKDLGTGCLRNLTNGGDGVVGSVVSPHLGHKHSNESRLKMRLAKLSKKRGPYSAEHRQRIAQGNMGKRHSLASRLKQSVTRQGRTPWNKGKSCPHAPNVIWTPEMREAARLRALTNTKLNQSGVKRSAETCRRIGEAKVGHKMSSANVEALRERMQGQRIAEGYRHTAEWKAAASERMRGNKHAAKVGS